MKARAALIGGVATLALAAAGGGGRWLLHASAASAPPRGRAAGMPLPVPPVPPGGGAADPALPIPPVPPRIAEGPDYEGCLARLETDPADAAAFSDAWEATGGGEGATHCHALALVAQGGMQAGAGMLQSLAEGSRAPAAARAAVFGQAGQAWLMAGDAGRAFGAATLALVLTPDDPGLLIDRANASANMERYRDAIDDLGRALDLDPRRADALVLRAAAWRQLGRLDLARDDVDRAVAADPENPEALLERGILRRRRGDAAGARADWELAAALAPDTPAADLARQNLALLEAGPERR